MALIGLVVVAGLLGFIGSRVAVGPQTATTQRLTAQGLKRESLLFMVTERVITQVMVESSEQNSWLGDREGILVATARLYHGIDLKHVTDEDIEHGPDETVVTVPRPQLLEFAVDPDMHVLTKRSGLQAVKDWVQGRDFEQELRKQVKEQALVFVNEHGLLPDDETALSRLNSLTDMLSGQGPPVRFVYAPEGEGEPEAPPEAPETDSE
ncbi:MAG: DUF4230 domain-containing protein [Phycisphaeraceae bacterium]|nr:DUF4230 domain-containing protein [Phycisphaeraceae bacterium]